MKLLYLQDSHIKGINPINRKGDYYQDVMTKIKEVIALSQELKVDKVIHGGDLFDSANVSNVMIDEFIDLVESVGIEWQILPGNHDEIGHNWELSKGSSLAHIFRRSVIINELTLLPDVKKFDSVLQGFEYYHNIEQDIKEKGLVCKTKGKGFKIAVLHALVTPKPFLPQVMHIPIKDIKTDFNVVLVAHNHYGWGIKGYNGVKFINIGCIGRTGIDEVKITPTVAYIDTETQEIRLIPLKTAKKSSEVFDIEKVEIAKKFEQNIDNFIKSLDSTKFQSLDLRGLIEYLAKENNTDKDVKEEVIKRIGDLS